MTGNEFIEPWVALLRFLNHVLVDAVGAIVFIGIINLIGIVLERYTNANKIVFCEGTRFSFTAVEVMNSGDAAIFISFIAIGVFKGIKEVLK